jgi:hypothetical protein
MDVYASFVRFVGFRIITDIHALDVDYKDTVVLTALKRHRLPLRATS